MINKQQQGDGTGQNRDNHSEGWCYGKMTTKLPYVRTDTEFVQGGNEAGCDVAACGLK